MGTSEQGDGMTEQQPDKYAVTRGEIIFRVVWCSFIAAVFILAVCAR
jgi:hypothetical protein